MDRHVVNALFRLLLNHLEHQRGREVPHPGDPRDSFIDRHGAEGHGTLPQIRVSNLRNVAAGRKVHDRVGAVVHGNVQLLELLLDVRGHGGIADAIHKPLRVGGYSASENGEFVAISADTKIIAGNDDISASANGGVLAVDFDDVVVVGELDSAKHVALFGIVEPVAVGADAHVVVDAASFNHGLDGRRGLIHIMHAIGKNVQLIAGAAWRPPRPMDRPAKSEPDRECE